MGSTYLTEWTEAREDTLREMWTAGHSCSEIAAVLGGTSRNAVIGKLHRMKLERRGNTKRPQRAARTAAVDVTPREPDAKRRRSRSQAEIRADARQRVGVAPPEPSSRRKGNGLAEGVRQARARRQGDAQPAVNADAGIQRLLKGEIWMPLDGHEPVPLIELGKDSCHWPLGDPLEAGFGFCGCPAPEGRPYCPTHARVAVTGAR